MIRIVNGKGEPLKTCLSTSVTVPQLVVAPTEVYTSILKALRVQILSKWHNVSRRETDHLVALIVRDSFKEQPLEPVVGVSSKFNISEKRSFL